MSKQKMKRCLGYAAATVIAVSSITACTPGNNVGGATVAGGVGGALLGGVLFHGSGSWMGVAAGALIGSVVGNQVGQYMDRQDKANMQHAIETVPVGQKATWTSKKDVTYTVEPTKEYRNEGKLCKQYKTSIKIDGSWRRAYGTACRDHQGRWKIVS